MAKISFQDNNIHLQATNKTEKRQIHKFFSSHSEERAIIAHKTFIVKEQTYGENERIGIDITFEVEPE